MTLPANYIEKDEHSQILDLWRDYKLEKTSGFLENWVLVFFQWVAFILGIPSPMPFSVDLSSYSVQEWFLKAAKVMGLDNMVISIKSLMRLNIFYTSIFVPLSAFIDILSQPKDLPKEGVFFHSQKLFIWNFSRINIYIILGVLLGIALFSSALAPVVVIIDRLFDYLQSTNIVVEESWFEFFIQTILFQVVFSLLSILLMILVLRFITRFGNKLILDSICVQEVIYLLYELDDNTFYKNFRRRKSIQARMEMLAKFTLLLASRQKNYSLERQQWVDHHFAQMQGFILERSKWLAVPSSTTLGTLRSDFLMLANIYISGQYGDFQWQSDGQQIKGVSKSVLLSPVAELIFRAVGFLLPLVVFGIYIIDPAQIPFITLEPKIATLILVAWFLIVIDSTFKLGVLSDLGSLLGSFKK